MSAVFLPCVGNKPNSVSRYIGMMIISLAAVLLRRSNALSFRIPTSRETLYFLQIGFATSPYHYGWSIVAFDSRSKTPIHVSLLVPTMSGLYRLCGTVPSRILADREVGVTHYLCSMHHKGSWGVRTFLSRQVGSDHLTYARPIHNSIIWLYCQ